jgi:hypothetical protein
MVCEGRGFLDRNAILCMAPSCATVGRIMPRSPLDLRKINFRVGHSVWPATSWIALVSLGSRSSWTKASY